MGLFSRSRAKKVEQEIQKQKISDLIVFEELKSDDDSYLTSLADKMMEGKPLILSFELLDIDQANKVISFLSGVVYAIKGEILNVKGKIFLFGRKDVFDDGSMEDFLKEIVE
ncbi:MAG: cell division protein SepF [Acholeplasmataceae bacterium]